MFVLVSFVGASGGGVCVGVWHEEEEEEERGEEEGGEACLSSPSSAGGELHNVGDGGGCFTRC